MAHEELPYYGCSNGLRLVLSPDCGKAHRRPSQYHSLQEFLPQIQDFPVGQSWRQMYRTKRTCLSS